MIAGTQVHEFMNLGEVGGGRWELASPVPPQMNMAVGLNLKVASDFLLNSGPISSMDIINLQQPMRSLHVGRLTAPKSVSVGVVFFHVNFASLSP